MMLKDKVKTIKEIENQIVKECYGKIITPSNLVRKLELLNMKVIPVSELEKEIPNFWNKVDELSRKCPKCGDSLYGTANNACMCWMLETKKITQERYDYFVKKRFECPSCETKGNLCLANKNCPKCKGKGFSRD